MIRAVAYTQDGLAILLGITEGNVLRLKSGMPLDIDLGAMLIEANSGAAMVDDVPARGRLQLVISYQPTHVEVVREWMDAGLPIEDGLLEAAAKIDATS